MARPVSVLLLSALLLSSAITACAVQVDLPWDATTSLTPTPIAGSTTVTTDEYSECVRVASASGTTATFLGSLPAGWQPPFEVLFHQTQSRACTVPAGAGGCDSGGQAVPSESMETVPIPLSAGTAELKLVELVSGSDLVLTTALARPYVSDSTSKAQVCRVLSFTSMTITSSGRLQAVPWNGESGGIVAVRVNTLTMSGGAITASRAGFHGGIDGVNAAVPEDTNTMLCSEAGGRGEGWAGTEPTCGRKRFASGGGGGCPAAGGGGGGGNAGGGGRGGLGGTNSEVGGTGGSPVYLPDDPEFLFGGGGGAGNSGPEVTAPGGAGGGLVYLIANAITGTGSIEATGAPGGCAPVPSCNTAMPAISGAASGGGAGGTLFLQAPGVDAVTLNANGGVGGPMYGLMTPADGFGGPGGGGGAGRIIGSGFKPPSASGGAAGSMNFAGPEPATAGHPPGQP